MKIQLFTAMVVVSEAQEAELNQIMDSSKVVSFLNKEGVGRIALLEYQVGASNEALAKLVIDKLANAPVIQARTRPI